MRLQYVNVTEASDSHNNSTVSEETFKEQIEVRGSVTDLLSTSTTSSISLDRMSAIFQEGATDSVNESNEESDKGEIKSTEVIVPDSKINNEMSKLEISSEKEDEPLRVMRTAHRS